VTRLRNEIASVWSFSLREFRMWQSYRANQVMWVADILMNSLLFFLVGRMIGTGAGNLLGPYGTNYISFILVGLAVNYLIRTNLSDPFTRVARVYWGGTMDLYLLSPMSVYTPLLGLMARSLTDDYPRVLFVAGFGYLFFGARFSGVHWALALLVTLLVFVAAFGVGAISASTFYLLDLKQGTEPLQFLVQEILAGLVAGTYYPVTVLPRALQAVALILPHTYAYDALRRLLCPGADLAAPTLIAHGWLPVAPVWTDALALAVMGAVLLPLGLHLYGRGIEKARRNGTLTRWQ
jgi:ABC-2 type transport system permease protein